MSDSDSRAASVMQCARVGSYCFIYITLSGGLINFNKFLVQKGRFPHPMALTAIHMFTSLVLTSIVLAVHPSMMPGVEKCKGRVLNLYKYLIPVGALFAVMLYGSNRAYMYCNVAFLQFMKEANVVFVFVFSAMAGLQTMNRQRLFVIAWVILGASLCVSGELHFVFIGFAVQAVSQLAECVRTVIAELVLTANDFKLDPLSYTFFVAPVCLTVLVIGNIVVWDPAVLNDAATWWQFLIPNSCIAVCLNVVTAKVIKEASALGFIITGLVKDLALVCFSSIVFRETISHKQWIAFMVTLSGVSFWAFMKIAPQSKMVQCFESALGVGWGPFPGAPLAPKALGWPTETTPLAEKKV